MMMFVKTPGLPG